MKPKLMSLEESKALDASPETAHRYWYAALRGEILPTHPHYVPCGFYRQDRKDGTAIPLAIWLDPEGQKCAQEGMWPVKVLSTPEIEAAFAYDTFSWSAKKAISYEAYEHWKQHRAWPQTEGAQALIEESKKARRAPKAKADPAPAAAATPTATESGIGHNSGEDPVIVRETFLDQVKAALAGVDRFKAVDSDEKAGEAQSLRSRLSELAGEGDKLRVDEKEPHLRASREVDEKWMPTIREAKAGAAELKKAIEAHATAKMRAEREQARLAAEQEQQRIAAEEAARRPKVTQASTPETQAPPAPAPDPVPTPSLAQPAESTRIAGSYGRATSAKVRKEIDTIDYRKVCDQFVDTNPELQALLRKIADRVIAIGGDVRGVTTKDVARIR